ncbi:unnamed protein product [Blepharisma stoltei]|uniref:Uncharacterized protein n=1 Tax=Blepharisma stoltei TaxID=1481888 RepID=A0AAU9K2N8_9CILI|nr:unnamed protein product [Blepharisma stoltei]
MRTADNSLYDRGMLLLQKKREVSEVALEDRIRRELDEIRDFPDINQKSRELAGDRDPNEFPEIMNKWLSEKNKKLDINRSQQYLEDRSQIRRVPTPPGYQSPLTDWEERVKHYFDTRNQDPDVYTHSPEINSVSRAMFPIWKEKVEDRLMRLEIEKHQKLEEMRQKNVEEIPTFKPVVNQFNKPRPEDVNAHLYYEGLSLIDRKQKAAEVVFAQSYPFKPTLNPTSIELAANRKNKPQAAIVEEEPEQPKPSRVLKPKEFEEFLVRNYVKPLEKTQKLDESENTASSISVKVKKIDNSLYDKGIKLIMAKEEKIRQVQVEKEKNELEGCTFKPQVYKRSKTPPPSLKRENSKKGGYSKPKGDPKETVTYKDRQGKEFSLKMISSLSPDLLKELENLEEKVLAFQ